MAPWSAAADWAAELRGVHTQVRRLEKAEAMVRDAISLFLDVRADSFDIQIEPVLPRDLQKKVGRARKVRGEAEALQQESVTVSSEVASELVHKAHFTVRDAGRVLGLSHQRIAQLLKGGVHPRRHASSRAVRLNDSQEDSQHRG